MLCFVFTQRKRTQAEAQAQGNGNILIPCACVNPRFHDEISALMFELVLVLASLVKTNQASASALRSDDGLCARNQKYAGFVQVMENLENHGIEVFQFPGLESHGI